MVALSQYRGIGGFGRAYQIMLENDSHAPGSVDRVLMERMIRLCHETAAYLYGEYTPTRVKYRRNSRPKLEPYVKAAIRDRGSDEQQVMGIARFCSDLGKTASEDWDATLVGGTEEEIICRGSDWCTDIARVGCALCEVAGFPARLVYLADTDQAYSGHVIIEVYRGGIWGAVDPTRSVTYRHREGDPTSTWELMNQPQLIEAHRKSASALYARVEQFRSAAITNYFIWEWEDYDYTVSTVNDYYRSILEMSAQGWPGGLRWLRGEDTA